MMLTLGCFLLLAVCCHAQIEFVSTGYGAATASVGSAGVSRVALSPAYSFSGSNSFRMSVCVWGDVTVTTGYTAGTYCSLYENVSGNDLLIFPISNIRTGASCQNIEIQAPSTTTYYLGVYVVAGVAQQGVCWMNLNVIPTAALGVNTVNVGFVGTPTSTLGEVSTLYFAGIDPVATLDGYVGTFPLSFATTTPNTAIVSFPVGNTTFMKPLSNEYVYHSCVNVDGNFDSGVINQKPSGACGGQVVVTISASTDTANAVSVGGVKLSGVEQVMTTVVGNGEQTMSLSFFDLCAAQNVSVFLNTSITIGVVCIDVNFEHSGGLLPSAKNPTSAGTLPLPGTWNCLQVGDPITIVCSGLITTTSYLATEEFSATGDQYYFTGSISCAGLSVPTYVCITSGVSLGDGTSPGICALLGPNVPVLDVTGLVVTTGSDQFVVLCAMGATGSCINMNAGSSCLANGNFVQGSTRYDTTQLVNVTGSVVSVGNVVTVDGDLNATITNTFTPYYQTSYVDGPPQAWFYAVEDESNMLTFTQLMEHRKRKASHK